MRRKVEAPDLEIEERTLNKLIQVFRLLADDSRLRILLLLAREGEIHVTRLCEILDESQPAVSHHLTLLRMANLVTYRRDGKFNYYYLDDTTLGDTLERLFSEVGCGQTIALGEYALSFSRANRRR
jgi:ArsR family transcriptional regulator